MQPRLLIGQNSKYFYFPEDKDSVLNSNKFSLVFLGAELETKEKVVIKQLSPALFNNEYARTKFEIEAGFQLKHTGLSKNIDFIVENNEIFLVQEFILGTTLKELIYEKKYYNYKYNSLFYKIIVKCLEVLGFIHSQGFCLCDIKPSNIIICSPYGEIDIENPEIKIINYGNIKKCFEAVPANYQYKTYNTQYASPEQIFGFSELIGQHSDIFGMGLVLFEAIAKEPALKINNPLMSRRLQTIIPLEKHYRFQNELYEIILKATANPELAKAERYYLETELKYLVFRSLTRRYQKTNDFIADLTTLL